MQLGQFSASVSVGGAALTEYAVEHSADGTEATCWIASENDKQFCVDWTDNQASASRTITGRLTLDGIFCGGQLMEIQRSNPTFSTAFRSSVVVSELTRRPLLFSKQALTDDDEYLNASISPHLGTIRLRIIHVRITGHSPPGPLDQVKCETPILHEKSKKAVGHSVQFGAEYQTNSLNTVTKTCLVKELVTFVFKYRPIELLQAEGIAPPPVREKRAVSPTDVLDLTLDVDEDDEDEAKIKKLEAELGALKNKRKKVKREPSDVVKKEIKSEAPIFKPGEVIDLT
ncbi:hypothetical protein B0H11DRAFT_1913674 [Mycena galericulata]|nr:hypothetical protein B0H11DRAFT_1913674 [Mycena galericulata]